MLYELLWTCEDLWRQLCLLPFRSPTRKCSTKVGCGRLWSLCELLLAWINCHSSSEAKCPESKKTSSPFAMLRFGGWIQGRGIPGFSISLTLICRHSTKMGKLIYTATLWPQLSAQSLNEASTWMPWVKVRIYNHCDFPLCWKLNSQGSNRFEGKSWWPSQAVWQRRRRIRLDTDEASSTMKFVRFWQNMRQTAFQWFAGNHEGFHRNAQGLPMWDRKPGPAHRSHRLLGLYGASVGLFRWSIIAWTSFARRQGGSLESAVDGHLSQHIPIITVHLI